MPIHLRRGQPIFLIWFARLDRETENRKSGPIHKGIDIDVVTSVAGELQSFSGLSKKIKDQEKSLGDRIHAIEREQYYYRGIAALVVAVVIGLSLSWVKDALAVKPTPSTTQNLVPNPPQEHPKH